MANVQTKTPEAIVEQAKRLGEQFSRELKTHQLRNFYSGITQIRQDWKQGRNNELEASARLIMLQPKLAYAAGRQPKIKDFFKTITDEINQARAEIKALETTTGSGETSSAQAKKSQKEVLDNFFALIEGIVAYHKFYGGD